MSKTIRRWLRSRRSAFLSRGAKRPFSGSFQTKTLTPTLLTKAAGFLSVWEVCGEVSINNIAVSENYRRKGIARALLQKMLSDLSGADSVTLEVRKSNAAAIALYESFGFERVGERRGFYEKPTEDALLMTKILNGET